MARTDVRLMFVDRMKRPAWWLVDAGSDLKVVSDDFYKRTVPGWIPDRSEKSPRRPMSL